MQIDNFIKTNRTSRNALLVAVLLAVTAGLYSRLVGPHINYLSAAWRYESVLNGMSDKKSRLSQTVEAKRQQLRKLENDALPFQNSLFSPDTAKEFLSDIQATSARCGCTLRTVKLIEHTGSEKSSKDKNQSGIEVRKTKSTIAGDYGNITELIHRLQSRPEKVWIDSLQMKSAGRGSALLSCDMTVTVYIAAEKEMADDE